MCSRSKKRRRYLWDRFHVAMTSGRYEVVLSDDFIRAFIAGDFVALEKATADASMVASSAANIQGRGDKSG